MSEHLPGGGVALSPGELAALPARWASSWTPDEVAHLLAGVAAPWYVAGGWAVDLFCGERTREHGDTEIAVPAARFPEVRDRFPGHALDVVGSGRVWPAATPKVMAAVYQTWVRDPATGDYRLEVFREPHDGDTWICRRDGTIRLPYRDIVRRTPDGVPYLAPELVLLFKAKGTRPKDQADFDVTVPRLTAAQRGYLAGLLTRVHPHHTWLTRL